MCRVDDSFIHGYVFYYWMCQSDIYFFSIVLTIVLALSFVVDF